MDVALGSRSNGLEDVVRVSLHFPDDVFRLNLAFEDGEDEEPWPDKSCNGAQELLRFSRIRQMFQA